MLTLAVLDRLQRRGAYGAAAAIQYIFTVARQRLREKNVKPIGAFGRMLNCIVSKCGENGVELDAAMGAMFGSSPGAGLLRAMDSLEESNIESDMPCDQPWRCES